QLGAMLGRPGDGLRLCVSAYDPLHVVGALPAAGWPGEPAAVEAALARYGPMATRAVLAFDLDAAARLARRLALPPPTRSPQHPRELLERLVADGLAAPARAEAVAAYQGSDLAPGADPWPARLLAARALLGAGRSAVLRAVNHVKLTLTDGRPGGAKAYLGAQARVGRAG